MLHETFMQMNTSLTEMNSELRNLRKDIGQMNELWEKYDKLHSEVSRIKDEITGKSKTFELIRNWGALAVAVGALLLNALR